MPLTTYVAGDVLTANSLNDNFTFAAANPPASAAGLTFISSTTVSAATSISLPANTFSATFANYRLQLQITALTTNATFTMRMRAAGTDNITNNYNTMFVGIDTAGTARNQTNANTNSWVFGELNASQHQEKYSLTVDVKNPQLTLPTTILGGYSFDNQAANFRAVRSGGAMFAATTSFDSLSFISSAASSLSCTIVVYGYALS